MKKIKKKIFFILISSSICFFKMENAVAETYYYVRAGATGLNNGLDWGNAYNSLPQILARGATYYIADGNYGGYNFNTPESGPEYITIKKATPQEHGTDKDWIDGYGNEAAIFSFLIFSSSHWIFDGQTGGGSENWTNGFGFRITNDNPEYDYFVHLKNIAGDIKVTHCDIGNSVQPNPGCDCAIYSVSGAENIVLSHNYIHHLGDVGMTLIGANSWIIENNRMDRLAGYGPKDGICGTLGQNNHGTGVELYSTTNTVIRYNNISNVEATGWIGNYGGAVENLTIHGNIFYNTSDYDGTWGNGIIYNTSGGGDFLNLKIYNNTFANLNSPAILGISHDSGGNEFKNNIIYGVDNAYYTGTDRGYNAGSQAILGDTHFQFLNGEPFVNPGMDNFRLKFATESGLELGDEICLDLLGNIRGTDGVWDRGAYEFVESSGYLQAPRRPQNLSVR